MFFRDLLEDLYRRAAALPFTLKAPTEQSVVEALHPPMPLFTLHFLYQFANRLQDAIGTIQTFPHRRLSNQLSRVPLMKATEIDGEVLSDVLHNPNHWVRTTTVPRITGKLQGYASVSVLQRCQVETFDTPENRFAHHFLQEILAATDQLLGQPWLDYVPSSRRSLVKQITGIVRQALLRSPLIDVGSMHILPLSSVCLHKLCYFCAGNHRCPRE